MQKLQIMLIAAGVLLLAPVAVHAQDTNAPRTELDQLESSVGRVIIKASSDIGSLAAAQGSVSVKCKESTDATSGVRQSGVSVTINFAGKLTDTTIIDYDELDSLIGSLNSLANLNWSVTTLESFNAGYMSRDGFRASVFSSQKRGGMLGAAVQSSRVNAVRISLTAEQFAQFRGLIQQAKQKLDTLRAVK